VRFEAALNDELNTVLRCACSYCRMRGGAAMAGIRFL
jgi:hypothetical protein